MPILQLRTPVFCSVPMVAWKEGHKGLAIRLLPRMRRGC